MKKDISELTAGDLATLFVEFAKRADMRVGHRGGGTQGAGEVPFDTGALQESIRLTASGKDSARVAIGGDFVTYAEMLENKPTNSNGTPNLHRGYIERLATRFAQDLSARYGVKITVTISGGNQ